MTYLLSGLDDQQLAAVTAPPAPLVVVAGAGSGKTTTLTRRIALHVARGDVKPKNILAVTHTTKAAGEIRDRLCALHPVFSEVACMTVHAAAWKIVRQFHKEAGFDTIPELVSSTLSLVRSALHSSRGPAPSKEDVVDMAAEFEWMAAHRLDGSSYAAAAVRARREPPVPIDAVPEVYAAYVRVKASANIIDFADVLRIATELLSRKDVGTRVRALWQAIVVDEFQDTDTAQAAFLSAVRNGRPLWSVVGDPRQTIYSFKGADPDILADAMKERGATVVSLSRSWRCSSEVVAWANAIIGLSYGPPLTSNRSGPTPTVEVCDDDADEVASVVRLIRQWRSTGVPYTDMAVLYRFNARAPELEAALVDASIPYQVVGAPRFIDRPEVREVLTVFGESARLDPDEDGRLVLRDAAIRCGFDLSDPPPSGSARSRWDSIRTLIDVGDGCIEYAAGAMLGEFLSMVQSGTSSGVSLSTIHAAKGLEWKAVRLVGFNEGSIPSSYAVSKSEIEEERRMLYVAVTRAQDLLSISYARRFKKRPVQPSRFLKYIPAGARKRSRSTQPVKSSSPRSTPSRPIAEPKGLICSTCSNRLAGLPARRSGKCSPQCLTGDGARRWAQLVQWRSSGDAPSNVSSISDSALFRFAVSGEVGPGWPSGVEPPEMSVAPPVVS